MASPGWAHVWDQQGYFKRLLSWDLSRQQLGDLESLARDSALPILRIKAYSDPAEEIEKRFNLLEKKNRIETKTEKVTFKNAKGSKVQNRMENNYHDENNADKSEASDKDG